MLHFTDVELPLCGEWVHAYTDAKRTLATPNLAYFKPLENEWRNEDDQIVTGVRYYELPLERQFEEEERQKASLN